ncbi:MAG: tyrosine-type recombinase/integrase [Phycisphaerales bacterium]
MHFVPLADTDKILAACPDHEWRLIVALSRYGGLRCPSEHLALRWADVDWEKNRLTVRAVKTETHAGGGVRFVPLFPELLAPLQEAFDRAEPDPKGEGWIITRYRRANCNLRTQFERIIAKAGVTAWPRLFHAMRASRQTELSGLFPQHVVCGWLGNSEAVAQAHYLQVTDADFDRAAKATTPKPSAPTPSVTNETAQNPAQRVPAHGCSHVRAESTKPHSHPQKRTDAALAASVAGDSMTPWGFEPQSSP